MNDKTFKDEVGKQLEMATSAYVGALVAVIDQAQRSLEAAESGRYIQPSANSIELHNAAGALELIRTLAADHLTRDEIREVMASAATGK